MNLKNSLKSIKKKMHGKEKVFTTIRTIYTHLSDLSNEEILEYYQVETLSELHTHIEHVKKVLKKQTENYEATRQKLDTCFCIDSRGDFKYLYSSKKEAEQQVLFSLKNKGVKLTLYACPFHCGWHVAKL